MLETLVVSKQTIQVVNKIVCYLCQKIKFMDKTLKKETMSNLAATETIHVLLKKMTGVKMTCSFKMKLVIILSNAV
jgi:hypothetical protein